MRRNEETSLTSAGLRAVRFDSRAELGVLLDPPRGDERPSGFRYDQFSRRPFLSFSFISSLFSPAITCRKENFV